MMRTLGIIRPVRREVGTAVPRTSLDGPQGAPERLGQGEEEGAGRGDSERIDCIAVHADKSKRSAKRPFSGIDKTSEMSCEM